MIQFLPILLTLLCTGGATSGTMILFFSIVLTLLCTGGASGTVILFFSILLTLLCTGAGWGYFWDWLSGGCGGSVVEYQATNPVAPGSNPGQSLQFQKISGYCKVAG